MKLTFLGTRGYIAAWNSRHRRHTATLISYRGKKVLIDYGEDWAGKLKALKPDAIVITHPHPDHAFGLKEGTLCPVYAIKKA
ncbi:MAG TPA: MBL fold metallo-hydrolase [Candidatus Binatia bacterium]|jgi:ribonuclease BN (tRNA processing enzyme)|nr:MBL fold metallo-hydrolase [Candidatus Binatia bacterium]